MSCSRFLSPISYLRCGVLLLSAALEAGATTLTVPLPLPDLLQPGIAITNDGLQFSTFQFRSTSSLSPDTITVSGTALGLSLSSSPSLSISGTGSQNYVVSFLVKPLDPAESISGLSILLGASAAGARGDSRLTGMAIGVNPVVAEVTGQSSSLQAATSFDSKLWLAAGLYLSVTGAGSGDMASAQAADIQFQVSAPEPSTLLLISAVAGFVGILRIVKNRWPIAAAIRPSTLP
jgi:hypothetical protein